jgi:hypothetical protein
MKSSGGLINNAKSHLFTWNTNLSLTKEIVRIFGFPYDEKWKSFKYLGIPLSLEPLTSSTWWSILEKLK